MKHAVSDDQAVVNTQGIRYLQWGEASATYSHNAGRPWFVSIQYKGNNALLYYKTEEEARAMFRKIRSAMDPKANE